MICLIAILIVLTFLFFVLRMLIAYEKNLRIQLRQKELMIFNFQSIFKGILLSKTVGQKIVFFFTYLIVLAGYCFSQLLRGGVWTGFIAVSSAGAGMATAACSNDTFRICKLIICSIFEAWERIKPTGNIPPFCR